MRRKKWIVSMNRFLFLTSILFTTLALTFATQAQTGPTGTWRVETGSQSGWEVFLRVSGSTLTGLVNYCATALPQNADIADGNIAGDVITFKCTSPDRDRTMIFRGTISGDGIT